MTTVTVRPMTASEYNEWRVQIAEAYAAEQVAVGRWEEEGAVQRAFETNDETLPQGRATPRMLILRGVDGEGNPVGRAWVGLDHPRGTPDTAFLHDIEVIPEQRGRGIGRALLKAVEDAVIEAGVPALELNVFGRNRTAAALYESAGDAVMSQQMKKDLGR